MSEMTFTFKNISENNDDESNTQEHSIIILYLNCIVAISLDLHYNM